MKKSITTTLALALGLTIMQTGCTTPAQKVRNAKTNVKEANKNLEKAKDEYLADVEHFRMETANKIAQNNQKITEFNLKIENEKEEDKIEYRKKIAELRQKNSDMKKKMEEYKVEGRDKWQIFKAEFSHDMEELGKAFKDLVIKNIK